MMSGHVADSSGRLVAPRAQVCAFDPSAMGFCIFCSYELASKNHIPVEKSFCKHQKA